MKSAPRELRAAALGAALVLSLATHASAQLSGSLSDDTTGPIGPGVHTVVGNVSVAAGKTLTVQPGAILKFHDFTSLTLNGALLAGGTGANPIVLTGIRDDSAGGDTNGDGNASAPWPGNWYGVVCNTGAAGSVLDHVDLRFAGSFGNGGLHLAQPGADVTVKDSTIRNCERNAIRFNNLASFPTVTGCQFLSNGQAAVDEMPLDAVPGFSSNSASGNGGDYLRVTVGTLTGSRTIAAQNCLGGALVIAAHVTVPASFALTLGQGVVWKMADFIQIHLHGTLTTNGTAGAPVVITGLRDDTVAGDTNEDAGGSTPGPGNWYGIFVNAGAAGSSLHHTEIRYAGSFGTGAIHLNQIGANPTLTDCVIRNCERNAIRMNHLACFPVVTGCHFEGNGQAAVDEVTLDAVEGFTANTATGNGGDFIRVTVPNPTADRTLAKTNCLGGALVIANHLTVPAGVTLTLGPGVGWKMGDFTRIQLAGTLLANGTALEPVVITGLKDDSFAGDTNGDGTASLPLPGNWYGILVDASGAASVLDHAEIRYAGSFGTGGIHVNQPGADVTLTDCVIRNCERNAIRMNHLAAFPTVTGCRFEGNGNVAVDEATLDAVPGFTDNVATGNGGNHIRVTVGATTADRTVTSANCLNGALVLDGHVTVPLGATLTLEEGVVFKMNDYKSMTVNGALVTKGTAERPVVVTGIRDDSVAGDTNLDGTATAPGKGNWYGIALPAAGGVLPSDLDRLTVRYAGSFSTPGIAIHSPLARASYVRVEHVEARGFLVTDAAGGNDWVAFDCGHQGIDLQGGAFALLRSTAAANGQGGIRAGAGFGGAVVGALAFGNGAFDLTGFLPGQLHHSNGSPTLAGTNGNIQQDPLFVDLPGGDLRLLAGSPCIDAGDPLDNPILDQDGAGFPRLLDGDLDGTPRVDMGAYEFDNVTLAVTGPQPFTPGGTMTFDVQGTAGLQALLFVGTKPGAVDLYPAGALYIDLTETYITFPWVAAPSQITVGIPSLPPLELVLQVAAFMPSPLAANLSNPVAVTIE